MPRLLRPAVLAPLILALVLPARSLAATGSDLYEIPYKGPAQIERLQAAGAELLHIGSDGRMHIAAEKSILGELLAAGIAPHLLESSDARPRRQELDVDLGLYRTYSEMILALDALALAHPDRAELFSIGTSEEGRTIYALKISDAVGTDEDETELLISGCHHARELMSSEIPLKLAEYLLTSYGTDSRVTTLVDEREIFIVPMLNPDGHVYVELNHSDPWWQWWRKNRTDNGDGSFGVDLNRNYGFEWGFDDLGSSGSSSSLLYRGASAFSELETTAMRNFCGAREFVMAFNYHSYGELLLYPWGYEYSASPEHALFRALGQELAASNGYFAGNPAEGAIYLTNGGSDDWMYGESTEKPAIYAFTVEVNDVDQGGFGAGEAFIQPTFDLLLEMNLRMMELAGAPQEVLPPVRPELLLVSSDGLGSIDLSWTPIPPNDPNPAVAYELEQIVDPGFVGVDDAEIPSPFWALEGGFASSAARANSGSGSYFGGADNSLSSALVTLTPYAVDESTRDFRFSCWYDIEIDYDYAYVELSLDEGLIWTPLAGNITTPSNPNGSNRGNGITGSSGGWVEAQFELGDYLGEEILLRVHYVTDGSVLGEGIYVDDVGPLPVYAERHVWPYGAGEIQTQIVAVGSALQSFRVRASDAEGDVSAWSPSVPVDPSVAVAAPNAPHRSRLLANHPNPFNPSTLLPYRVGGAADELHQVDLSIFSLDGRRVARPVRGTKTAGEHEVRWNGTNASGHLLPSGVYFARLQVDSQDAGTRKLVLLK